MSQGQDSYRFALEHFAPDGRCLGQTLVTPDFQPALECAYFAAVRKGALPLVSAPATGAVAPLWSEELGPPYCSGIRVMESEFSSGYFLELAQQRAAEYIAAGELAHGDSYRYRVRAYPAESRASAPDLRMEPPIAFGVEALHEPIALDLSRLDDFLARSESVGEEDALDVPVFVAEEVLCGISELAKSAGELETGGVLVGRLHCDALRPEVFVEITAQIPARHAEARGASFAFTPETWAAADAAIALRGGGELLLSWWHFHPNFCRGCPEERRSACAFARPFFSSEDRHLHRTCFPRAWQLALLASDLPDQGITPALFGWRKGSIVQRGFHVTSRTQKEKS
jgi:hypothetical protein